jgi:biotin carboxyl carrier protein
VSGLEARVGGQPIAAGGWSVEWVDRAAGIARVRQGDESHVVVVEGDGRTWFVSVAGRRLEVDVSTWRERFLAEAETSAGGHDGPVVVTATLPGLVVVVGVSVGDEVEAGAPLVTIEAMKMQNEVRAPRGGRVVEVTVLSGQTVATGAPLLRME